MRVYHFNVGGKPGELGFTAEVRAKSTSEAVRYFNNYIKDVSPDEFRPLRPGDDERAEDETAIVYFNVWLNDIEVSESNIDEDTEAA